MSTIIKRRKDVRTYSRLSTGEIAHIIQNGMPRNEAARPEIIFAADYRKRGGELELTSYCGMVTLRVKNLPRMEEVNTIMNTVRRVPYTHLAWRDEDGRSLYIVCRIACPDNKLSNDVEEMQKQQTNGYKMLHYIYSTQLQMHIDTFEPRLDNACGYSHDPQMYYNADSLPYYVDTEQCNVPTQTNLPEPSSRTLCLLPGMNEQQTLSHVFHCCRQKALIEARKKTTNEEDWHEQAVCLLARYCFESKLPLDYAMRHARWVVDSSFNRLSLDLIFMNAYESEIAGHISFGHIERSALLTMRTEAFLKANYELRRNMLTGIVQYRQKNGYDFGFENLTEQAMNSMTLHALKNGLGTWDKDIHRLINSKDILLYNPLHEYLFNLPKWDGKDRIEEFCQRIPTDWTDMHHYLHTWLLSMVAHWLGKDRLHANAIVPLLIGQQGCGKTTVASILLPRELREYYNDKVDFRSEGDLMSSLSRFALINIDEFDALKRSQQPTLKYLLSKSDVKVRPIYGKAIEVMPRYASFLATTNKLRPLVDRTGSRRFVCIRITDGSSIDTTTPIDYPQFYAQLMEEINSGRRYWINEEETIRLLQHNAAFIQLNSLTEIIDEVLTPADDRVTDNWMTGDEVLNTIIYAYPSFVPTNSSNRDLSRLLREKGYRVKRCKKGMIYSATRKH